MSTNNEDKSAIGGRWRAERARLSLSRKEVAVACGRTQQGIGEYERGVSMPGGQALLGFSGLGADVNYILTGSRCERQKVDKNTRTLSDEQKQLLDLWFQVPETGKAAVFTLLSELLPYTEFADLPLIPIDPDRIDDMTEEEWEAHRKAQNQALRDASPAMRKRDRERRKRRLQKEKEKD
ncbi:MAG: hypothetical protein KZQ94_22705 [Candidatus Thiodiazotropha sp. (ex Troendleina suluensis)]|nr:hypothetical protein [Candidatus Thiodiazotropha sp. (ex Troendleina suluensis)]